ncbi:hypothetical protein Fmac_018350 [Flemingia macrophylla]|uniref:Polygalacturonase n=1 Tax=Flemingia macrophylla TaxID=520843 RepID=A0ABD1M4Q5_9FABA
MGEPHHSSQLSQPLMATPLQHYKGQCVHGYNTTQARAKNPDSGLHTMGEPHQSSQLSQPLIATPLQHHKGRCVHGYNTTQAHAKKRLMKYVHEKKKDKHDLTSYQSKIPNNEDVVIKTNAYGFLPFPWFRRVFIVDYYGATPNDARDDTKAFAKAWHDACSTGGVLVVPPGSTYHLKQIVFSGPCLPNTSFRVYGTIKAWPKMSAYEKDRLLWIKFLNVANLSVDGGGTINGNGRKWWETSCKINPTLAVQFLGCDNLSVTNLRFKNAQQMHVRFQRCHNVTASNLIVKSPEHSPNTDGIHVTDTKNIVIMNSAIGTGDDCISIVSGSKDVLVTNVKCGPGHGISIGSLGVGHSKAEVSDVLVNRAFIIGTSNGVRIKTWQRSAVQVSNIIYQNIVGTSASEEAIKFDCSKTVPCKGIYLQNVNLTPQEKHRGTIATCKNVEYANRGMLFPPLAKALTACESKVAENMIDLIIMTFRR